MQKKEVLYLRVDASTKKWLAALCAKQVGRVSQSTMAEQIFLAARKLGIFDRRQKQKEIVNGKSKI